MMMLIAITLTLGVYAFANALAHKANHHPLLAAGFVSIFLLVGILLVLGIPYDAYFAGAQPIHLLLGPATVAFALPIYQMRHEMRRVALPLTVALVIGSAVGIFAGYGVGYVLGLPGDVLLALAPKSVTTPIAMGIMEKMGGDPSLATVLVIMTGVYGAATLTTMLKIMRVKNHLAQGFAAGLGAAGYGTARAFQVSEASGAFAGLALALNGIVTAFLLPVLIGWVRH